MVEIIAKNFRREQITLVRFRNLKTLLHRTKSEIAGGMILFKCDYESLLKHRVSFAPWLSEQEWG